jgi:hypothetical protein
MAVFAVIEAAMYQFSRAIYRELAPHILAPPSGAEAMSNHAHVLRACEEVVERMATDHHSFARPARTLFCNIRNYFPMAAQKHVHQAVSIYLTYAERYLEEHPLEAHAAVSGAPPQCRATTRKGTACQRVPLSHNGYCPSHQHLADTEDRALAAA